MTDLVKIATVSCLPIWKRDSTAAEWLQECAAIAMEFPERFDRCVLVYEECNKEGLPIYSRLVSRNIPHNNDLLGTLQAAQMELFDFMKGR